MDNEETRINIKKRLSRIEGQVRGIQKMVDNNEGCNNILIQIAAIRSAINKVGGIILENYAQSCINETIAKKGNEEAVNELIDTIVKFTRYYEVK